jgi:hypothetical protein
MGRAERKTPGSGDAPTCALVAIVLLAAAFSADPSPALAASAVSIEAAEAPSSQLGPAEVRASFGVRFRRYRQELDGVPVLGADAVIADGPGAEGDLLLDRTIAGLRPPGAARIERAAAVALAERELGGIRHPVATAASVFLLPRPGPERLVWRVVVTPKGPPGSSEVLVDARSGEIVRVRSLVRGATGNAWLYDTNPIVVRGSRGGLADNNDGDSFSLTQLRRPVTLQRLLDGSNCLVGLWVKAELPSGGVCAPAHDWPDVTRSDNRFEALMAYFHVDRAQAYVQSLGFSNVVNQQLLVTANAFPEDASYYDTITNDISLGYGGTDDGEDGDVIVHEYGHAIQDHQVPGFGGVGQAGAIGEGFGDYFAAAIAATYAPNSVFDPCVAEWDAIGLGNPDDVPCIRRVDTSLTAAQLGPGTACNGAIHCWGTAWSSALWQIRSLIGGAAADRMVIQSHFALPVNASFHDASVALLSADRQLHGGAHFAAARDVLVARGLLDPSRLVTSPGPAPAAGTQSGARNVSDVDRDGIEEGRDNCPRIRNRDQRDWDRDGRGDRCDSSARVRLVRAKVRDGLAVVIGTMLPRHLAPSSWRVRVLRWSCRSSCRYRRVLELRGARRISGARLRVRTRLAPGRYRLTAILRSRSHRRVRSAPLRLVVR